MQHQGLIYELNVVRKKFPTALISVLAMRAARLYGKVPFVQIFMLTVLKYLLLYGTKSGT